MAVIDKIYDDVCMTVLQDGFTYQDKSRSNIDMLQVSNYSFSYFMSDGFPLLTTKKIFWKTVAHEFIWMLSGSEYINYLRDNGVKIWDKDVANFNIIPRVAGLRAPTYAGPIYGCQWRKWNKSETDSFLDTIDQLKSLLVNLKENPFNRRHIVTAWNPSDLHRMCLPPCHWSFEVLPKKINSDKMAFDLKWHQRSVDTFLGLPFDIALYAFMGKLIELQTGYQFHTLIADLSNVHFYGPHIPLIKQQLKKRRHRPASFNFDSSTTFDNININRFNLYNYVSEASIKAQMYAKTL